MSDKLIFSGITEAQRLLIAHWAECRDSSGRVARESIDPGTVRSTLACLSIVEMDELGAGRFRIAGSRLRDIFGFDVRGRHVSEIAGTHGECYALGLSAAIERGLPVGGLMESGSRLHAWLRLPLADDHGQLTQVLCHDELIASRRVIVPSPADTSRFAA